MNTPISARIEAEFLNPAFSMLDLAVIRRTILDAVRQVTPEFFGTVLDIGCGYKPYESLFLSPPSRATRYIGMDLADNVYLGAGVDRVWDGSSIPLEDESVECAVATEFLEHCACPEVVLREIYRVLKPGGLLFLTVPFLYPLHEVPHDMYRYTPFSLHAKLDAAGFGDHRISALGGLDAAMAIMIGLWIRQLRSRQVQRIMWRLAVPIVRYLYRIDKRPEAFTHMTMITGLAAVGRKAGGPAIDVA
jgi:SAM-dependent methyltransferase